MKLIFFFIFLCVSATFATNAKSQTARVNIHVNNAPAKEVIAQIETQTDYLFVYNNKNVDMSKNVSINMSNAPVAEVLAKTFENSKVVYVMEGNNILLMKQNEDQETAQDPKRISGTVTDSDGEAIIGASVSIIANGAVIGGGVTNLNGQYDLPSVPAGATLKISFIGYTPAEFKIIAGKDTYDVTLRLNASSLEEVVVIGYGVQKKKLVTGSTINITGENIESMHTTSAIAAMQSQAPGLNIVQNNGQPGSGYVLNIRGMGTTGDSTPLYIIDGVAGGSISSLNPADIESIDVLKDAASAAIYGARAANGIILVTTKQGKKGKVRISYDGYYAFQNPNTNGVKSVTAQEYMDMMNKAMETAGSGSMTYDFAKLIPVQYAQIQAGTWNGTDWFQETVNKNAPNYNHSINITGGSDVSRFSIGFSNSSQEGTLGYPRQNYYSRSTVRMNTDYTLWRKNNRDILILGENALFSKYSSAGVSTGNIYSNSIHNFLVFNPLLPAHDTDGSYYSWEDQQRDKWNYMADLSNPLEKLALGNNESDTYRIQGNAYLEFKPLKSLKYRSVLGYRYYMNSRRQYSPKYKLSPRDFAEKDKVQQQMEYNYNWTWENTVNYTASVKQHNFDLLVGQAVEKSGYGQNVGGSRTISKFPGLWDFAYLSNTESDITPDNVDLWGGRPGEGELVSVFGRLNYNFKETYLASVIMRADGSSNFARGHRWGYFPSFSAGWVLTNESFMEPVHDWANFLKLRATWGQNGNCNIPNFNYLATISLGGSYTFNDDQISLVTGAYPDILPNPDVTWETSEQTNIGLDSRFLNNRLGLILDWYIKDTKDWLLRAPTLASFGTGSPYINGGSVRNKGWEMTLNWNDHTGKFYYGATLNFAHNKNEVTEIKNTDKIINGPANVLSQNTEEFFRVQVGYPMGYFYGYKTGGIFQNQQQIDDWIAAGNAVMQGKNVKPGDVIFLEKENYNEATGKWEKDGQFNENDKVMLGSPHPKYTLGLNLNFAFKGIDFAVTGSGALGMQVAQSYRSFANNEYENYTNNIAGRFWTGEGSTNSFPRFTYGKHVNLQRLSDIWLQDADYLKIRDITLGYDFKTLFKKIPLGQLRLFATLQNYFTFTGYDGMDPEVGYNGGESWASGIDIGYYPSPKSVMFGLNVKF